MLLYSSCVLLHREKLELTAAVNYEWYVFLISKAKKYLSLSKIEKRDLEKTSCMSKHGTTGHIAHVKSRCIQPRAKQE